MILGPLLLAIVFYFSFWGKTQQIRKNSFILMCGFVVFAVASLWLGVPLHD